jgi:guanylate kinase
MPLPAPPLLIVLSGPSAVGKDSILEVLKARHAPFHFVVTATTRPKREGERDGVDYLFLDESAFNMLIENDELLEHATVYEYQYGVPKEQVYKPLSEGRDVIVRTDIQGVRNIKNAFPDAITIFVAPPSLEELESRMRERDADSEEQLALRLAIARQEMASLSNFEHIVLNQSERLDEAVAEVESIIASEKRRRRAASTSS